jgi:hypothetical protein
VALVPFGNLTVGTIFRPDGLSLARLATRCLALLLLLPLALPWALSLTRPLPSAGFG